MAERLEVMQSSFWSTLYVLFEQIKMIPKIRKWATYIVD